MARNRETRTVQNPALLAAGARADVLAWRQQSGVFRAMDDPERIVRAGLPGMADSALIVAVEITPDLVGKTIGVAVQAEFKTDRGQQSEPQRDWQRAVEARGAVYAVVRSAEDMQRLIEGVQRGEPWR